MLGLHPATLRSKCRKVLYLLTGLEEYKDFDEHGKEEGEGEDEEDFEDSLDGVTFTNFLTDQIFK